MIASPDAPQLDQDALLHDFISGRGTLMELAADHGLSLTELIAWYEDDATQDLLKTIDAMAARRAAILARSYSPGALTTLAYMLDNPSLSLVERRRTATQILRQAPRADAPAMRTGAGSTFTPIVDGSASTAPNAPTPEVIPGTTQNPVAGRRAEPREPIAHSAHSRPPRRDRTSPAPQPEAESPEAPASPLSNPPIDAG